MSITPASQHSIWAPSVAATSSPGAAPSAPSSPRGARVPTGVLGGSADPFQQLSAALQGTLLQIQGNSAPPNAGEAGQRPNSATSQPNAIPPNLTA